MLRNTVCGLLLIMTAATQGCGPDRTHTTPEHRLPARAAATAPSRTTLETKESARAFVQGFYDWYAPLALREGQGPTWAAVTKQRAAMLSPALLRALDDDLEAQAKVEGEIVGLDFDPFLASQDPCERYEAGAVTQRGRSTWVEVHRVCAGERAPTPDVTAELERTDRGWRFVDFHYPRERDGLLAVLKQLRSDRR